MSGGADLAAVAVRLAAQPPAIVVGMRAGSPVDTAAFLAEVHAWRALLAGLPGRRFALYLEDSLAFGAALLGAWQAGKTVWVGADTLAATCARLKEQVDGFLGDFPPSCAPLFPVMSATPGACGVAVHALDPEADAVVVFTSGSTGQAQAIPKTLRQLACEVAVLEQTFGVRFGAAQVVATVSHQHIYGMLFRVLWPLSAGRVMHAGTIAVPEALPAALAAQPCVLVASPAFLKRLPAQLDWHGARNLAAAVFSSGGPLPREAAHQCAALLGTAPVEVLGSSETGGIAWRQAGTPAAGDDGAWTPFSVVAWRVVDGMLEVQSPYLPDGGWLQLPDRATADGDLQRFHLHGRADRLVKVEEKRIALDAVERALLASGLVQEAVVVPCAAEAGRRQALAAFAVLTAAGTAVLASEGKPALNGRLRGALVDVVDSVGWPRRWRYLERLPVNAQGKTTVAALLALLDAGPAAP